MLRTLSTRRGRPVACNSATTPADTSDTPARLSRRINGEELVGGDKKDFTSSTPSIADMDPKRDCERPRADYQETRDVQPVGSHWGTEPSCARNTRLRRESVMYFVCDLRAITTDEHPEFGTVRRLPVRQTQ